MKTDLTTNPEAMIPPTVSNDPRTGGRLNMLNDGGTSQSPPQQNPDLPPVDNGGVPGAENIPPGYGTETYTGGSNSTECFNCEAFHTQDYSIWATATGYFILSLPLLILLFIYRKPILFYFNNFIRKNIHGLPPISPDDYDDYEEDDSSKYRTGFFTSKGDRRKRDREYQRWFGGYGDMQPDEDDPLYQKEDPVLWDEDEEPKRRRRRKNL